ncbi:uncharacterized protein [Coffea arabica]|uniref:Uncharacterized protein n=1 Tax=Coffea arabica TaxID=13443 RepID=A0ABM4U5Z8_COFAR
MSLMLYVYPTPVIWQRLDCAFSNTAWSALFGITKVSYLMCGRLDHAPLLIKCGVAEARGKPFRYLNVWARHPDFLKVVKDAWDVPVQAIGMEGIFRKLMGTKAKLREWNKTIYGNISQQVVEVEHQLKQREKEYDTFRNEELKLRLGEARVAHTRALAIECDFWRHKAPIKWNQLGDANMKFFNASVKHRQNVNFISQIRDDVRGWVDDAPSIQAFVV